MFVKEIHTFPEKMGPNRPLKHEILKEMDVHTERCQNITCEPRKHKWVQNCQFLIFFKNFFGFLQVTLNVNEKKNVPPNFENLVEKRPPIAHS